MHVKHALKGLSIDLVMTVRNSSPTLIVFKSRRFPPSAALAVEDCGSVWGATPTPQPSSTEPHPRSFPNRGPAARDAQENTSNG